jgi:uncharacterized protein with HEPN domain
MSKEPIEYLKHIRDESLYLLSVTGKGITREEFLNDERLKRAVVRSLDSYFSKFTLMLTLF